MKTYQNEYVSIRVEGSVHLLSQTWTGLPGSEPFRTGTRTALLLARQHSIKRWLIDLRTLRLFNPTDLHWFAQRWLPRIALCPSIRVAIVLADPNQFARMGTDLILRASTGLNHPLTNRYFVGIDDARQWLMLPDD